MGRKNILIEGVSGSGKTTVAEELERRGYHVIHGDRTLADVGEGLVCDAAPTRNEWLLSAFDTW